MKFEQFSTSVFYHRKVRNEAWLEKRVQIAWCKHASDSNYTVSWMIRRRLLPNKASLFLCNRILCPSVSLHQNSALISRKSKDPTGLTRSSKMSLWWTWIVTRVSYLTRSTLVRSRVVTSISSFSMSKKNWFLCAMIYGRKRSENKVFGVKLTLVEAIQVNYCTIPSFGTLVLFILRQCIMILYIPHQ